MGQAKAKQYNVPCMNDAAADTPPVSHLWDYTNMGYDLVTFSGGKAMRGLKCAGCSSARRFPANALLNNSPYEDNLFTALQQRARRNYWDGEGLNLSR